MRPLIIGTIMGLMLPFALHGTGTMGAIWFVLGHLAVAAVGFGVALIARRFWPQLKLLRWAHRPDAGHVLRMGGGLALGWGMICALCVALYLTGATLWI